MKSLIVVLIILNTAVWYTVSEIDSYNENLADPSQKYRN